MRGNNYGGILAFVADHGSLGDKNVVLQGILNRLGSNEFSAGGFDQVFLAVGNIQKTITVNLSDVTGFEPAICCKCRLRFLWHIPIAFEYLRPFYQDLAV